MSPEEETISRIKSLLKLHAKGLTISEISSRLKMNRNSAAKYLEVLLISGQVEKRAYGTAKVFFLTHRIPISSMLSFSPDFVLALDENHKVVFCNDNFLSFLSLAREDVVGRNVLDIFLPGTPGLAFARVFSEILTATESVREVPVYVAGKPCYFRIRSIKTVFDDGTRGITLVTEEVTEEKKYQIELGNMEARYRGIVEDQTDFITRFLPDGVLTFVNAAYARYLGKKPEEIIGKSNFAGIAEEDRPVVADALSALSPENPVTSFECRVASPSGMVLWQSWTIRALFDGRDSPSEYQGVGRDCTDKHEAAGKINQYIADREFLSQKALDFIELPFNDDICGLVVSGLESIVPEALLTTVALTDPDMKVTTIRSVRVKDPTTGTRVLVKDFTGRSLPDNGNYLTLMASSRVVRYPSESLYGAMGNPVMDDLCRAAGTTIEDLEIYGIGFTRGDHLLGSATLFLPRDAPSFDIPLIETYARQASIALQKRMIENSLLKSEELFSSVAESSPFPITIIDPDGRYRFINRRFIEVFGYSLSDFTTGREWFRLAYPEPGYRNEVIAAWKEDLARASVGTPRPRTFSVVCRDGSKKEVVFRPVTLSDGKQFVVYEDITERRNADRNRQLLASIIESTGDAVIGKDINGTIISWNRSAERIYGYAAGEIIGRNILVIIPHTQLPELEVITSKILRGQAVNNLETTRVRKDGTIIDVALTISPITDETGTVIGASTITRDISRLKADDQLVMQEKEDRITKKEICDIIDFIPDPACVLDIDKNVLAWNRAMEILTGVSRANIIGTRDYALALGKFSLSRPPLVDLIDAPDAEIGKFYANIRREGSALAAEMVLSSPQPGMGITVVFQVRASPLTGPGGERIGAIETLRELSDSRYLKAFASGSLSGLTETDVSVGLPLKSAGIRVAGAITPPLITIALAKAHDGIAFLDLSIRCIWANGALLALLGKTGESITGTNFSQFVADEMRKLVLDQLTTIREKGSATFPFSILTPHGRMPVEASVSVFENPSGESIGYFAIIRRRNVPDNASGRKQISRSERNGKLKSRPA